MHIATVTQLSLALELYDRALTLVREDKQAGRVYDLTSAARKIGRAQYATLTTGELYEVVRCYSASPRERTSIFLSAIRGGNNGRITCERVHGTAI